MNDEDILLFKNMMYGLSHDYCRQISFRFCHETGNFPPLIAQKDASGPQIQELFKSLRPGCKSTFSTDAGVYAHGKRWLEMEYMNRASMPTLKSAPATWNALS
jgi:hypothetical protein